jgi:hypothetical protein
MVELNGLAAEKRYAAWLRWGTYVGLGLLVLAFIAYLAGLPPHFPIAQLPEIWKEPATRPPLRWAAMLPASDMLVIAAIAFLTTCSIACLAAVLPVFRRHGETAFVVICVLQVAVLVLAASGLLSMH